MMPDTTSVLDETVRKKYELKYLIVEPADRKGKRRLFPLLCIVVFISVFGLASVNIRSGFLAFVFILFFVSSLLLGIVLIPKLNKHLRNREVIGFVRFFPHYMIIEQKNKEIKVPYNQIYRIVYANGLMDDYFGKHPNVITRRYKIICKDERFFFFECECFIRANKTDRKEKDLPDVGYVMKRIIPPGGIYQSNREIRKTWKSTSGSDWIAGDDLSVVQESEPV